MSGFDRSYLQALGAYGKEANEADWKAGKDFKILHGPYFSIRDVETMKREGVTQIIFLNARGFVAFTKDL